MAGLGGEFSVDENRQGVPRGVGTCNYGMMELFFTFSRILR